ncbi:MAG TPA: zinc ribbon domain-containing protein [Nitrososphaeraceae archaeon]|nr:zinc ribbon domain-containing protein [Nitrososphaeraceae archaeon]
MSFGVDTLGALTEKLKKLVNETQDQYESFIDTTQLYKQGKVNEKEFFANIGDYLVATSALNFLAIRVILEIKSAIDKGTSIKNATGGISSSSSTPQTGFGIGSFIGSGGGGTAGTAAGGGTGRGGEYTMPKPSQPYQQEPTFKPIDIEVERSSKRSKQNSTTTATKNCIVCGSPIPKQAKFCSKCGNSQ